MILREEILKEHSKAQCRRIVDWIGNSPDRFNELFQLFLTDEYRVVQRAAWPLSYCAMEHPELIRTKLPALVQNLHKPGLHVAVKRNTLRLLQEVPIPDALHGEVMDTCFTYITSPDEPAAVKAFSLTILQNMLKTYPEIGGEIKLVIEERWDYETAAFRSRARKVLKML